MPLTLALANVRAVTDERVTNAERSSNLASCRRYLEQQARLVDDLVTFAQVGTRCAEFRSTASEAALKWALSNLKSSIDETGAVVTHNPLPSLWADESQIRQLFQYLIAHSIKYRGEIPPRIHLAAERQGEEWVFSIADNGIGFDPDQSERLFTICRRLREKDKYGGTGFDLAICKKIVERHAGHIWAESAPGQGSRFFFTIPTRAGGGE
jgi:chemotaxis family two-component system sensor kinase Cph1